MTPERRKEFDEMFEGVLDRVFDSSDWDGTMLCELLDWCNKAHEVLESAMVHDMLEHDALIVGPEMTNRSMAEHNAPIEKLLKYNGKA